MSKLKKIGSSKAPRFSIFGYVCCLLILSMACAGIAFSKYSSSSEGISYGRAAKFDVTISVNDEVSGATASGASATDVDLYPGADGELANFKVTGTAEVSAKVVYTADILFTGWKLEDDSDYCPIIITVNDTDYYIDGVSITTVEQLAEAVDSAIEGYYVEYQPNQAINNELNVTWAWSEDSIPLNDTYISDLDVKPTITMSISCVAKQID